jgi:hypothetical protein
MRREAPLLAAIMRGAKIEEADGKYGAEASASSAMRPFGVTGVVQDMMWQAIGFIVLIFALIALMPEFDNWSG